MTSRNNGIAVTVGSDERQREGLIRTLSAATFLIFFQAYMVAPLFPRLSHELGASEQIIGLTVPAYMIPYGLSTLFFGLLADRFGRRRIMYFSMTAFIILTALTATAMSAQQLILWRLLTGLGASGVVPLALALMGDLFPYEQRGRPLGWLFGAMAGGMAFGSTVGVILAPFIGWRMLLLVHRLLCWLCCCATPIFSVHVPKHRRSRCRVCSQATAVLLQMRAGPERILTYF